MTFMNRLLASLILLGGVGLLTSCSNTWHGAKKDTKTNLENADKAIEKAVRKLDSE